MTSKKILAAAVLAVVGYAMPAFADTFAIDASHSSILFKINHLGVSDYYGRFNDVSGNIAIDRAAPEKSSVDLAIKVDSVDTNQAKRDEHLRGPDFFNSKQFPSITFKSTGVKKLTDKEYEVTGNLTMKGVTKPITMKVALGGEGPDPSGKHRIGFNSTMTLKRSEFGVNFMPDKLGEEVTLILGVEGVKS